MTAKELRRLMPQDAHDVEAAKALVALGAEELRPVVNDILRELKDIQSPVALVYCAFLAKEGEPLANEVAAFLWRSGFDYQKYMIVGRVLPFWSKDSVSLSATPLQQLATTNSGAYDTDLWAIRLLGRHQLAERNWLIEWLAFKQAAFHRLSKLAKEIHAELK